MISGGNPSFVKNCNFVYPSYKQKYVLNGSVSKSSNSSDSLDH